MPPKIFIEVPIFIWNPAHGEANRTGGVMSVKLYGWCGKNPLVLHWKKAQIQTDDRGNDVSNRYQIVSKEPIHARPSIRWPLLKSGEVGAGRNLLRP